MKILHVTYRHWPPDFGGELLASIERFQGLVEKGCTVTVLTGGSPGFAPRERQGGLDVLRSPIIGRSRFARLLRRIVFNCWMPIQVLRCRFDALHFGSSGTVGPISAAIAIQFLLVLARLKGARTVVVHSLADTEHCAFNGIGWRGFWRKAAFQGFDRIVAVGPALYEGLKPYFGARALLVPYGVRDDVFARSLESRQRRRSEASLGETDVIFVFLGSVGRRKGFDLLAEAFAQLAANHSNWHLWVIGPYTKQQSQNLDEQEVAEVCKPLQKVLPRVKFWGRVDSREEISTILSASDIFVFPSRKEGMPISPMEAMAAGLPLIIARIPGVTDVVNVEGETGLYIPQDNVEALKSAMLRLGSDRTLSRHMGERAGELIRASFGWTRHINTWLGVYGSDSPTQAVKDPPELSLRGDSSLES